jgi:hypothetical protein
MGPLLKRTFLSLEIGLHTRLRGIRIVELIRMHLFAAPQAPSDRVSDTSSCLGTLICRAPWRSGCALSGSGFSQKSGFRSKWNVNRPILGCGISIRCPSGHSPRGYQELKRQPHLPRDRHHRLPQEQRISNMPRCLLVANRLRVIISFSVIGERQNQQKQRWIMPLMLRTRLAAGQSTY